MRVEREAPCRLHRPRPAIVLWWRVQPFDVSMLKRILPFVLFLWALVDGVLTAGDMPTPGLKAFGFFASFLSSVLFFAAILLAWTWVGRWSRHLRATMRPGQWLRRSAGPAAFAQAYTSGLFEFIEYLSASLVLFAGRKALAGASPSDKVTFVNMVEMVGSGFEPIERDSAPVVSRIQEAQMAEPELFRSSFRVATGFLYLYSQNCANRHMNVDNARKFTNSMTASLCQGVAGRFGFDDDPQQVAKMIDGMVPQLCCDKFLDAEAYGLNDALGRLVRCLSLSGSREIQYGFVVGSMKQQVGCAWAILGAAEAIDDSIGRCAKDMRW